MAITVRDAIRILEGHGFHLKRQKGSHRQFEGIRAGSGGWSPSPAR